MANRLPQEELFALLDDDKDAFGRAFDAEILWALDPLSIPPDEVRRFNLALAQTLRSEAGRDRGEILSVLGYTGGFYLQATSILPSRLDDLVRRELIVGSGHGVTATYVLARSSFGADDAAGSPESRSREDKRKSPAESAPRDDQSGVESEGRKPVLKSPSGNVKLFGKDEAPVVGGEKLMKLTPRRYEVVSRLISHPDATVDDNARQVLIAVRRLAPQWHAAIKMAGRSHQGYRIP